MNSFTKRISKKVEDYIALRRSLDYVFLTQSRTLRAFCRYIEKTNQPGPLTDTLALAFVHSRDVTPLVRARRYGVLRHFAEYLSAFDHETKLFSPHAFPCCRSIAAVRILNEIELVNLLRTAKQISPLFPMRGNTLYTLLGLIASTGIRSGEALRLDCSDVDLERGLLQIRQTKFRKDRVVPMHDTTCEVLASYAAERDYVFPQPLSPAFFLSLRGGRLSTSSFYRVFHEVLATAGFDAIATRPLRPHHLRHRFAVTRLLLWRREGIDVQARLPLLATYLGHVHYSDTAYYITATADLLAEAAHHAFVGKGEMS